MTKISKLKLGRETVRRLGAGMGPVGSVANTWYSNDRDWCDPNSYCIACEGPTGRCPE